jgi:hypothetical protein
MKWFEDGDQVVVTKDDFVDLQESPAVFINGTSDAAAAIRIGGLLALPMGDLLAVRNMLKSGGGIL